METVRSCSSRLARGSGAALGALAAALLAAPGTMAAPAPGAAPIRDRFLDGSGHAPALVAIPGGAFLMGSQPGSPGAKPIEVPHEVVLAPFAIARTEVTREEYARFLDEVGARDEEGLPYLLDASGRELAGAERLPVVGVSWRGALAYAAWLSRKTGRDYRLPTEAQWERAARAGSEATWPWGERAPADVRAQLRCDGSDGQLAPVAITAANAYGVHDLLGNAWEWTLDCFALDFYFYSPTRDPRWLDPACAAPSIRGGSAQDDLETCRPGFRMNFWWRGAPSIGFRVVRLEPP